MAKSGNNPKYSVVVPAFCEADSICELVDRVAAVFTQMGQGKSFDILIVDDGSTDDTPDIVEGLCHERTYVRLIRLRRNCGKSLALMAGFEHSKGDALITIDADLQDHPEDIPKLLAKLDEGYGVVSGWRQGRKDTLTRRIGSYVYNTVVSWVGDLRLHDHNCGLKAYSRRAASAICIYGQYHRYSPLLSHIAGFKVTEVPVENSPRKFGSSKYKTFRYQGLFDLLSISFTHKFGANPLHFFGGIGLILIVPSFLMLSYWLVRYTLFALGDGGEFTVFSSLQLSVVFMVMMLGILTFLLGFVCDFILHHMIRSNIKEIISLQIDKVIDSGGTEKNPENSAGNQK
ncbi:MAG: glycosyltransferase family 2 protein [Rhodospirillales bacterium]|nr:glycosyltransferase family 2 protein [Rhodospirillales bacterium]